MRPTPRPHRSAALAAGALALALALGACGGGGDRTAVTGGDRDDTGSSETSEPGAGGMGGGAAAGQGDGAGGGAKAGAGAAEEASEVKIVDFAFTPETVKVAKGQELTWTNDDAFPHTVEAEGDAFESENLEQGDTFSHKFEEAGRFPYICGIHTYMTGTVVVE